MILKFNTEVSFKNLKGPRVFNLPPHINFVRGFVDGLLLKFESQVLDSSPELLSQVTILASNKVLARKIEEFLVKRNYFVLPKIIDLGNISDLFYEWPVKASSERKSKSEFRVVSRLKKFLLLNKLINEIQAEDGQQLSQTLAFDLAESLIRLVEELNINDLNSKDVKKLTDEDLPEHLQLNLGLLNRVLERYEVALCRRAGTWQPAGHAETRPID